MASTVRETVIVCLVRLATNIVFNVGSELPYFFTHPAKTACQLEELLARSQGGSRAFTFILITVSMKFVPDLYALGRRV